MGSRWIGFGWRQILWLVRIFFAKFEVDWKSIHDISYRWWYYHHRRHHHQEHCQHVAQLGDVHRSLSIEFGTSSLLVPSTFSFYSIHHHHLHLHLQFVLKRGNKAATFFGHHSIACFNFLFGPNVVWNPRSFITSQIWNLDFLVFSTLCPYSSTSQFHNHKIWTALSKSVFNYPRSQWYISLQATDRKI